MAQRFYLNVPFAEKDEARMLGARWDGFQKRWFVEGRTLTPFMKWMDVSQEVRYMPKADTAKAESSGQKHLRMQGVKPSKVPSFT